MKRLISPLTLLLLGPAFAGADCAPAQTCVVTSGTTLVGADLQFPLNFAGRDFSASGVVTGPNGDFPFGKFFEPGSFFDEFFSVGTAEGVPPSLSQFELTVNGVPWGIPAGSDAGFIFFATLFIPAGSSDAVAPFSFEGHFKGAPEPFSPGLGCDVLNCVNLEFRGSGLVTSNVQESGTAPGFFEVESQTFTFAAVPEPATLSLFAVGLVGLAMRRRVVAALGRHS